MEERRRRFGRRVVVLCERVVLSAGMTVMALVIERRLVRAVKGGLAPAPRTALGTERQPQGGVRVDTVPAPPPGSPAAPQQVGDQGQR